MEIAKWFQENWVTVLGVWYGIDQILKVIAPLTKTKIDDNLSDIIGKLLAKFAPKK